MMNHTHTLFSRSGCKLIIASIALLASQTVVAADCQYRVVDEWNSAYKAEIAIVNDGEPLTQWALSWPLGDGEAFSSGWNATYNCAAASCTATPPSWNPTIHTGQTYTFGVIINKAGNPANQATVVSGDICNSTPTTTPNTVLWQLDGENSALQYVSMKKDHTAETNTFLAASGEPAALSGSINSAGEAIFAIDLNDVATGVDIRNSRLLSFLFETEFLPTAYFRMNLDTAMLDAIPIGDMRTDTLIGTLSLHGVPQMVAAEVLITKISATELQVSTLKPVNIDSKNFDMASGIEALRVVANLSSIGEAVPVYFHLRYVANTDNAVQPVDMPAAPADPSTLTGEFEVASSQAQLDWQDNSDNETLFLVRRKPLDGHWQTVAELAANSTTLAEGLPESGEFDYKIIALNNSVPSLPSNITRVSVTESNQIVRGQQIYGQQCAGCHGNNGQGIDSFPPINTERDVATMIAYIQANMPLGNAAACDQQCAEDVAAFIETLWVSAAVCDPTTTPVAYGARQLKILTRAEYQNSVQDLLGVDFNAANGLSADSKVGFFTNNTHAAIVASSYSNFLLVAEDIAQWSADQNFAPALNCTSINQACATQLINTLAPKIFRRPLTADESATYQAIANGDDTAGNIKLGMQLALEGLLSSPQFLYRHELGEPNPSNPELASDAFELTSYEMATFLAYTFTGSTPDQILLAAAAADELRDEANITAHAQRLAGNAQQVMGHFVGSWLGTADLGSAAKDPDVWPGFEALVPHMQQEINATFSHIMLNPDEKFSSLYAGNFTFLNETLANHYGLSGGVNGETLQRVNTNDRGGILANGAFMARWAEAVETSPILRSVRVRRRMLCQDQPDPPAGTFAAREEKLAELAEFLQQPSTTNRQKYHRLTEDAPCTNCHAQYINPLGFGMEDFDTVGRLRNNDLKGNPVDPSGELYAPSNYSEIDEVEAFFGTQGLGLLLSSLPSAQSCLPKQLFRYVMGVGHQEIDGANPEAPQLSDAEKSGYACEIDTLTTTMMNNSPRAMLERFGSLKAVRYRKAWARD